MAKYIKAKPTDLQLKPRLGLRVLRFIELVAAMTAIVAIGLWYKYEYPAMQQDRLTSAWTLMNMPGQGGKKQTLEYLASRAVLDGETLYNIDLSRETHGPGRVRLNRLGAPRVKMIYANFSGADLRNADFSGANIDFSNFKNMLAEKIVLQGTRFTESDLSGANFFEVDLRGTEFINVNISDANFMDAILNKNQFKDSWAWDDSPPSIPTDIDEPTLILHKVREKWTAIPPQDRPFNPAKMAEELKRLAAVEAKRIARKKASKNRTFDEPARMSDLR